MNVTVVPVPYIHIYIYTYIHIYIHIPYIARIAVPFMWGSLRLAPIIPTFLMDLHSVKLNLDVLNKIALKFTL